MKTTRNTANDAKSHQTGSALIYILIAVALLAALTATFMQSSGQQASSQNSFRTIADLKSQVNIIRSAIQECMLSYQRGDLGIDISPSGTDPGARRNMPIKPNSTHYNTATLGPTTGRLVRDLRCPGNPGGNDPNHVKIFGGNSGKFMPPPTELFEEWEYYNGGDGVFFWTRTNKTDPYLNTALLKLDESYDECEADIIDASSGAQDLDSTSEVECESGFRCFRIRQTILPSAVYNGDDDGDEAPPACP